MAESAIDRMGTAEPYAGAPVAVEEEEDSIDFVALFQTLRRGKRTIFGVSLAFFVLATIYAFLLPFMFTSTVSFTPMAFVCTARFLGASMTIRWFWIGCATLCT